MSPSPLEYLKHIHDEMSYLMEASARLSEDAFAESATYQRAFARSFEIIGEATKHLGEDFRAKYPAVPWSYMAKMRDKLIHHYFGVDYEMVWRTAQEDVPAIKELLHVIIQGETRSSS